jgi:hypothetical protein
MGINVKSKNRMFPWSDKKCCKIHSSKLTSDGFALCVAYKSLWKMVKIYTNWEHQLVQNKFQRVTQNF